MDVTTWLTHYCESWLQSNMANIPTPEPSSHYHKLQLPQKEGNYYLTRSFFFPVAPWGLRRPDPTKSDVLFWLVFRRDNHNLQIKHQTSRGNAPNEYCLKCLWNEHLMSTLPPFGIKHSCIAITFEMRVDYWDKRQSEIKRRHFRQIKAKYLISKS